MQGKKKPWPTNKAMAQIYEKQLWGGQPGTFYSGEGSHNPDLVVPYVQAVRSFLTSFEFPLSVCDFGCGDFNIGKNLVEYTSNYTGIDIVRDLIAINKRTFKAPQLSFTCADLATDDLPEADCVMLRQVLQHLSNAEVQNIVSKLTKYKYVILTEHIPQGDFEPNIDIISGQGIRLKKHSGLNLLAPPFNLMVKEERELLVIELADNKGVLKTVLYRMF